MASAAPRADAPRTPGVASSGENSTETHSSSPVIPVLPTTPQSSLSELPGVLSRLIPWEEQPDWRMPSAALPIRVSPQDLERMSAKGFLSPGEGEGS